MSKELEGKRALVTGAASGMGRAIALAFAGEGAVVAAHARSMDAASSVVDEIQQAGGTALAVAADLTDSDAVADCCEQAVAALGGIDIVVNNAGAVSKGSLTETNNEDWDRLMQVNLKTPFLVSKYLVPEMRKNSAGGRLIFNSSVGAKLADPTGSAYNASKAGLLGFVRCLAAEVGADRITVNAICPGWVDTPMAVDLHREMHASSSDSGFDEFYDASIRSNMLNARLAPENIADFAVFLASDKGKYITAQAINVCAGLCYT